MFSDGAHGHFKQRFTFNHIARYERNHEIKLRWFFLASCHGKGPWDGVGAAIKCKARAAELLRGLVYTRVSLDLFRWARKEFSNRDSWPVPQVRCDGSHCVSHFQLWFVEHADDAAGSALANKETGLRGLYSQDEELFVLPAVDRDTTKEVSTPSGSMTCSCYFLWRGCC